jgi:hypothetical protein
MAVKFTTTLKKFKEQGEKTGWTYVEIPAEIAEQIKPNHKKSYRVKGSIDNYKFSAKSIIPMGEGNFIMPVDATIRKAIKKTRTGEKVVLQMEEDKAEVKLSTDLLACLEEDAEAKDFFFKLPKSHQNYYSKWIESAKTDATKAKRIAMALNGFANHLTYPEMLRADRENKLI